MLHQQAFSFLFSLAAGFAAGFIFDVYQVIRRVLNLKKVGTAIGDVLAWLVIAIATFAILIFGNWAEMRVYVLAAIILGLGTYIKLFSRRAQMAVYTLFRGIYWLICTIIRTLVFPIRILLVLLSYPVFAMKWLCLLIARISEYFLSFPQEAISNVLKGRQQPPPEG